MKIDDDDSEDTPDRQQLPRIQISVSRFQSWLECAPQEASQAIAVATLSLALSIFAAWSLVGWGLYRAGRFCLSPECTTPSGPLSPVLESSFRFNALVTICPAIAALILSVVGGAATFRKPFGAAALLVNAMTTVITLIMLVLSR